MEKIKNKEKKALGTSLLATLALSIGINSASAETNDSVQDHFDADPGQKYEQTVSVNDAVEKITNYSNISNAHREVALEDTQEASSIIQSMITLDLKEDIQEGNLATGTDVDNDKLEKQLDIMLKNSQVVFDSVNSEMNSISKQMLAQTDLATNPDFAKAANEALADARVDAQDALSLFEGVAMVMNLVGVPDSEDDQMVKKYLEEAKESMPVF